MDSVYNILLERMDHPRHLILDKSGRLAFISHASEDDAVAELTRAGLAKAGIRTWIDDKQLHGDSPDALISTRIADALASATDFVAIVSSTAIDKPWVTHEWLTASARWLASGRPKIHLVLHNSVSLPELPFTSVRPADAHLEHALLEYFATEASSTETPNNDSDWQRVVQRLRLQYLMGGATAVQAVHEFDFIRRSFELRVESAMRARFVGADANAIAWLRALARLLDLRADNGWLAEALIQACHAPTIGDNARFLLNNLGVIYTRTSEWEFARSVLEQAIQMCFQAGDEVGAAIGYGNLALAELERSGQRFHVERQIAKAREVLDAHNTAAQNDRNLMFELLSTKANLYNHEGRLHGLAADYTRANLCFGRQLSICESLEHRRGIGVALGRMGWTDVMRGNITLETFAALRRYMALSVSTFNPQGAAYAHCWTGEALTLRGDIAAALTHFQEAVGLHRHNSDRVGMVRALSWAVLAARRIGDEKRHDKFESELKAVVERITLAPTDLAFVDHALQRHFNSAGDALVHEVTIPAAMRKLIVQ